MQSQFIHSPPQSAGWVTPRPLTPQLSPMGPSGQAPQFNFFDWQAVSAPVTPSSPPPPSPLMFSHGASLPTPELARTLSGPSSFAGPNSSDQFSGIAPMGSDPANDLTKPPFDYKTLVKMALETEGSNGMTICQIYAYVLDNFAYYRLGRAPPTWRSRIRNVLTVNDCFRRIPDPKGGRKGKWVIHRRPTAPNAMSSSSSATLSASTLSLSDSPGLKSPRAISNDHLRQPGHQRSISTGHLSLDTNKLSSVMPSHETISPSAISLSELSFSFDDEDIAALNGRTAETTTPHALFERHFPSAQFAPSQLTNVGNLNYAALSGTAPNLICSQDPIIAQSRGLSAASMEFVEQLASQLREECTSFNQQQKYNMVAPIA